MRLALIGDSEVALGEILNQVVTFRHLDVDAHVRDAGFKCRRRFCGLNILGRRGFRVDLRGVVRRLLSPNRR